MTDLPLFRVGEYCEFSKTITESDVSLFAGITGDFHPLHINQAYVESLGKKKREAHVALLSGLINNVLCNQLPGQQFALLRQQIEYLHPVSIGDTVTITVEVKSWLPEKRLLTLRFACRNQNSEEVIAGEAVMIQQISV